ncbi:MULTISPECIES: hypothetical protein [unclassified Pigmentiphaga]|uniref:hypothetical protein n=1 Tax=unclassified Pigmentiphaga TaxID=2626614 RepID=UPI000B420EA3|nr:MULTISPECIES: hypothetical protein [unclassified Pigmentiphaga]
MRKTEIPPGEHRYSVQHRGIMQYGICYRLAEVALPLSDDNHIQGLLRRMASNIMLPADRKQF